MLDVLIVSHRNRLANLRKTGVHRGGKYTSKKWLKKLGMKREETRESSRGELAVMGAHPYIKSRREAVPWTELLSRLSLGRKGQDTLLADPGSFPKIKIRSCY